MSGYRLCQIKQAEVPYYIENISTNIYSIEELCYYMQHNIYLLDETIMNEELCDWIQDELGLKKLYHTLYQLLDQGRSLGDLVLPIFREIGYLTHEEFKTFNNELLQLEHEPEIMRQKLKADYLVEYGKYGNALNVYEQVLEESADTMLGGQFTGEIFHNIGCVYMRLFQYEEAADYFRRAYECLRNKESLKNYLTVVYLNKPEVKFLEESKRMGADDAMVEGIQQSVRIVRSQVDEQKETIDMPSVLEQLTREYHNHTGL